MNIAIVEDDAGDREYLLDCICVYTDDMKTAVAVSTFENADAFLGDGTPGRYDLIFLDIYMDEVTGMELAQRLRRNHVNSQFVFTTTSAVHAVESYEVGATYYLLKPYDYAQFAKMMKAVDDKVWPEEPGIAVKVGHDTETVPLAAIRYVDYADHYVRLHTDTRTIRSYGNFQEMELRLADYPQFLTCYRNMMINMDRVDKLDGNHFELEKGEIIPITRNRVREMREAYTTYIFARMKRGGTR